jgi:hypothetical protein
MRSLLADLTALRLAFTRNLFGRNDQPDLEWRDGHDHPGDQWHHDRPALQSPAVAISTSISVIRQNGLYGLRTPARFADEQVWYEANAFWGRDVMALGSVLILVAFGFPSIVALPSLSYSMHIQACW